MNNYNWLEQNKYLFIGASSYVQLALLGVQIILKYAPPLFNLISDLVDEGFEFIEAAKAIGKDVKEAQKAAREGTVVQAKAQFPDVPETRIRAAIEDMVDVKKVVRTGTDESRGKEAHAVQKGIINIYEVERMRDAYPLLFGENR